MKEKITEIPEKSGFYTSNNGYRFIAYKRNGYETKAVKQAKFETMKISQHDMLMILDISSFMYTLLKNGHIFNKIVAVTGCGTKEKMTKTRNFKYFIIVIFRGLFIPAC